MTRHTEGPFRVLAGRNDDEWLLLDVNSADPAYLPRSALPDAETGNVVDGDLRWDGEEPTLREPAIERRTRFRFRRTDEEMFEAARSCFETAREEGEAMNSRVTYDTDRNPNGIVYTFAEQPGEQDLFAEFRDGTKPLEPLLARAADGTEPPFSVWILSPEAPFVAVYIVLGPDSLLERTMRDTYD